MRVVAAKVEGFNFQHGEANVGKYYREFGTHRCSFDLKPDGVAKAEEIVAKDPVGKVADELGGCRIEVVDDKGLIEGF